MDTFKLSHRAIIAAGLPASTEVVAHRLLVMADEVTGQVNILWDELCELTGCNNIGSARRHLTRLANAKLIHYSTNDYVYVTWLMWMTVDYPRAESARGRADMARGRADSAREMGDAGDVEDALFGPVRAGSARGRADMARGRADSARGRASHSHARLLVSQSTDPIPPTKDDYLTDCPAPERAEQERSVALLRDPDVGMDLMAAWRLAGSHRFEELTRQVMTWRRQLAKGMVDGPGALVNRIDRGYGAVVTDDDRKTELYRRHHPEEGAGSGYSMEAFLAQEQRKRYRLDN